MRQSLVQRSAQILTVSGDLRQSFEILEMSTEDLVDYAVLCANENPFLKINYDNAELLYGFKDDSFLSSVYQEESLKEHLIRQIRLLPNVNFEMATVLTDYLREDGYLSEDICSIAIVHGYKKEEIEKTLLVLQSLEPTGCYAQSLEDCLVVQAKEKMIYDVKMAIALRHLKLVADNKVKELSKVCECNVYESERLIILIKSLNPKPGLLYGSNIQRVIIPEVIIRKSVDNKFFILPNEHLNNMVMLSDLCGYDLRNMEQNLSKQRRDALLIIKAMAQRISTVVKAVNAIVSAQYDFFMYGIKYLKPMNQKSLADSISVHESTISRIANKYVMFNDKHYQIKFFFNSAIGSSLYENTYANKAIKEQIKHLVSKEEKDQPLSDDQIKKLLNKDGFKIARRTVTKYRESIGIEAFNIRKRTFIKD